MITKSSQQKILRYLMQVNRKMDGINKKKKNHQL
jgi:hypothetical protein